MTDDNDLMKRLREGTHVTSVAKTDAVLTAYMHEAADRIEALEAELEAVTEALEAELKKAKLALQWYDDRLEELMAERKKAVEAVCIPPSCHSMPSSQN